MRDLIQIERKKRERIKNQYDEKKQEYRHQKTSY